MKPQFPTAVALLASLTVALASGCTSPAPASTADPDSSQVEPPGGGGPAESPTETGSATETEDDSSEPTASPTASGTTSAEEDDASAPAPAPSSGGDGPGTVATPTSQSPTPSSVTPTIVYAGVGADSMVRVNAFVADVVEENGTCSARLTGPGVVESASSAAIPDATATWCEELVLGPINGDPGDWSVVITYESPVYAGSSTPTTVSGA